MKNKERDQLYCGVREDVIKNAHPILDQEVLGHLTTFIQDRYEIHLKKDVLEKPSPWTDNPIFQTVKFTNVRREHDRQSKNFIRLIASQPVDWFDKFWNTVMFRMFNMSTIWESTESKPFKISKLSEKSTQDYLRKIFGELEEKGIPIFTNAFNTGGLKQCLAIPDSESDTVGDQKKHGGLKVKLLDGTFVDYRESRERLLSGELLSDDFEPSMPMRIIRYIANAANNLLPTLHQDVFNAKTQKEACDLLTKIRGFGRFLSYQVFVDLTYCEEFPFSENEFTVSGPGCDDGLDKLFVDRDGMSYAECLFWLRDNQSTIFSIIDFQKLMWDLPEEDRCLNVMSLENLHCELQKYLRGVQSLKDGKKPRGKVGVDKLVNPPSDSPQAKTKKLF